MRQGCQMGMEILKNRSSKRIFCRIKLNKEINFLDTHIIILDKRASLCFKRFKVKQFSIKQKRFNFIEIKSFWMEQSPFGWNDFILDGKISLLKERSLLTQNDFKYTTK